MNAPHIKAAQQSIAAIARELPPARASLATALAEPVPDEPALLKRLSDVDDRVRRAQLRAAVAGALPPHSVEVLAHLPQLARLIEELKAEMPKDMTARLDGLAVILADMHTDITVGFEEVKPRGMVG
jgi:hypothetical protein